MRSFIASTFLCLALSLSFLRAAPLGPVQQDLVIDENAPAVQMLVPGFTVRELNLSLNNINSLVCAPDGRIFGLGYDGNVHQITIGDEKGNGDAATYFFKNDHHDIPESIGMAWGPGGLYIATRGRVIRLRDKGDGSSEVETVASGWPKPTIAAGSSLDSVGVAVDKAGNVYFGLGADAWSNPYRTNEAGEGFYNIHSERGTIQKLSADWKHRETICTGMRFTVALAFNGNGDLFATDQEGATWLSNGNPFDELLQILPQRHYGFPPRHPKFLPDAIDEPSVFDYAPQHESTCGLHFNEPVGGGTKIFGPDWWRGDAIVSGESRGKIWHTKLVKTPEGYVARNSLIACLRMLTIDATPTPNGDLLVTCHSGKPDWGTGPEGKGKLFLISYTDRAAAQPIAAYAAGPDEFHVVFDRRLDPLQITNLARGSSMEMGKYVTAGNRYETFRPGYKVVEHQLKVPRYKLPVLSADIMSDGQTLALRTVPCADAVQYAITLPGASQSVDVAADLSGVEASWSPGRGAKARWSGWLPHLDLQVAQAMTAGSEEHRQLFDLTQTRGRLALRARLDLWSMLHPAVQPGEKLAFEYPPEKVTVTFSGNKNLKVTGGAHIERIAPGKYQMTVTPKERELTAIEASFPTGPGSASEFTATWFTDEDPRPRAFPLRRILMPWAKAATEQGLSPADRQIPQIAGGEWNRGRKIFFSDQPGCFKCHQAAGQGGKIGPDLSNLVYRDYTSVMKDIIEPSAAINPEHLAYNVQLTDGGMETGVILSETPESVTLGQVSGKSLEISRKNILRMKPSAVSLMPEGLLKGLNSQQQKDLLTFLLTEPQK
jgi:putative heme-binding domain-containing protein